MTIIKHFKVRLIYEGEGNYSLNKINSANDAQVVFSKDFDSLPHEEVMVIYVNGRNHIIGKATVSMGGLHGCALLPRDVFRGAIAINASAIIMAHNHPSGDPTPSVEDLNMTCKVKEAGSILGISLLDHLVIAGEEYRSINELL